MSKARSAQRKKELISTLEKHNLKYKHYGDCYSFVHHGEPKLSVVIKNEQIKEQNKAARRDTLRPHLDKLNIAMDEDLPSVYNYVHNVGCKTLEQTVKDTEVESFFKTHTNFHELIHTYSPSEAKEIALCEYVQKQRQLALNSETRGNKTVVHQFN